MKAKNAHLRFAALALAFGCALPLLAQTPEGPPPRDGGPPAGVDSPPPDGGPGFDGPPPFGPGGFGPGGRGPGGPGGMMQETKLVKQFDKDGDGYLNAAERKAAREYLASGAAGGRGRRGLGGRGGPGGRGGNQQPPQPGPKLAPADVKSFPNAPLYDPLTLRTIFLEFEDADWEKELMAFHRTDVEVPAKLTVDGKTYPDVGVHFHGMSSFMMVGEGQKHSMVLSLDFVHKDQQLGGYRKLTLLNSADDPSFLDTVLSLEIARDYLPAPKANFMRVAINGECWGIYVNQQHFNKDFVRNWFGTTKGARWKVPGSPDARGGLEYLGDDASAYKQHYEIKSKDNAESWADFIKLCKVLNETPAHQLEKVLAPLLDIDGALKFIAWDNALVNDDGYWTRASDYEIYEDKSGRFHIIPYDANETFSSGGGPGGPGGPRGRGGPGGFGPGMFLVPQILDQADKNEDGKLTKEEFAALADAWYDKPDTDKTGKVTQEQFIEKLGNVLPPPQGRGGVGPPGGGGPGGGRGGFGPAMFMGPGLFTAFDANKDGSLTRAELKDTFAKWFSDWDTTKSGMLNEESLRNGLAAVLPRPNFGDPGGGPGGQGGGRGRGGPGFGGGGVNLDPLVAASDSSKPLLAKLLAVPSLRTRYLGYVRDIAEKWLDWNKLGPLARQYHALIADDVKADTRKLDSFEAFQRGVGDDTPAAGRSEGGRNASLKNFAEKRRVFLLDHTEVKKAAK